MSRIGKKPIVIPKDVKVEIKDGFVYIEGPKGRLNRQISNRISLEVKDDQILLKRVSDIKLDKSLHGLYRALIVAMIKGVTEGYVKELEVIGVGFKVQIQADKLILNLGFSHPVSFSIPEGIKIETPKATHIVIRGIDKEKIGQVATEIRSVYPPEPYKGKGIRFIGEYIKKKVGKAQTAGK